MRNMDDGLYCRWRSMIDRCYYSGRSDYKYYGAKGIRVCKEWHRFINFKLWFDENRIAVVNLGIYGDDVKLEVDRINPKIGYEPSNCRLVSHRDNVNRSIKRNKKGRFTCH